MRVDELVGFLQIYKKSLPDTGNYFSRLLRMKENSLKALS